MTKIAMERLTNKEVQAIKVLNFISLFDGIIEDEESIRYILKQGIEKFISPKRHHLVSITDTAYPIRIKYDSKKGLIKNQILDNEFLDVGVSFSDHFDTSDCDRILSAMQKYADQ